MQTQWLEDFIALEQTRSFTRAAELCHLSHNPHAPNLQRRVECDSADAIYEYVLKGLGVAWLPWSMVHADCKLGRLALAADRRMEVRFDVRLYRPKRRLGPLAEDVWQMFANR